MAVILEYSSEDLKKWWPAKCDCGWRGLTRDCTGGDQIADTGDYDDPTCPVCTKAMEEACKTCGGDGFDCEDKKNPPCTAFSACYIEDDDDFIEVEQ